MIRTARFAPARRASAKPSRRSSFKLRLEALEDRLVPTGTWSNLANLAPDSDGIASMLLLPDGTVMAQGVGPNQVSKSWYRLTPDANGSYVNGSWSQLADMGLERLYTASNVLQDGRVFELGGEYSGPQGNATWINTGEIYNPLTNTWTPIPNFPQSQFGDDPSILLPNGDILCGYLSGPQTYIYHPATNTWSAGPTKLLNDVSDEETWVKLPNGDILSYDVFNSQHAQRLQVSTMTWVDAGITPAPLETVGGFELGPALLLPDGRVFQIGGNNHTALYTPPPGGVGPGSWAAGPDIPGGFGANDAPAAMLPNGKVLFCVGPQPNFDVPTQIYEYDPTAPVGSSLTDVTPSDPDLSNTYPFVNRMLMLPTGQVLFADSSSQLAVYTPDGGPLNAWRPTVSNVVNNSPRNYTLTGTQLNGLSQGASYGDDAEMDTNYPIVQLTAPNGNVYYARTYNWSSTGVATGNTVVTTRFETPLGLPFATYQLRVIASGIASVPRQFIPTLQPPIALADTYTTQEDNVLITNSLTGILANDIETSGAALQAILVSNVSHGSLVLNSNGSFRYTPNHNSNNNNNPGPDSFTYMCTNGQFNSNVVTVTLNVTPVNDPPVASPDGRPPAGSTLYLVHPGATLDISAAQGLLANDIDPEVPSEGQTLSVVLLTNPLKASSFTLNANGSFSYTAAPGTTGDDQFFYEATDGQLFSSPTRVLIHINTPTLAQDDKFATYVGNLVAINGNVLTNDIDHDITNNVPDTLTASLVSSDPSKGTLILNPDGTFSFAPNPATFTSGSTTFTYKVNDGWEDSNIATVTIYMDRLPVANNDTYGIRFGNTLEIFSPGVLANDTDADLPQPPNPPFFQYLNVSQITQQPAHGTLNWSSNGYFQYTPNADFNGGVDTFKYRLNDGLFDGSEGTVTINVQGIPVARDDAYVTFSRSLNVAAANGVLVNDTSPNANLPVARLATTTSNGQLTLNPDGSFQYFANAGFTGIDQFTYVASVPDPLNPGQTLDSFPATVSITVYVNSAPPIARDDAYTTPINTALNVPAPGVIANDTDPNGDPMQAFLVSAPHNGTLTLNYNGSFLYTPQTGFQGIDSYTYQVNDGRNFSNVATVTITVGNPVITINPAHRIIEAQDVGGTVKVFAGETGQSLFSIQPYGANFAGGIRVAVGDLNGDGVPDIITAPGPTTGAPQRVRAFNGVNGAPLNGTLGTGIFPFGPGYKGGIQVASGDVNDDGTPDFVVGADTANTNPQVRVINGATGANFSNWLGGFSPYTGTSFGGVRVAVGDVNGDGKGDIIVSPGAGTPTVKVYNAAASSFATGLIRSFSAYTTNVTGGVFVAAGDLDGDGRAEIVTGAAANPNGQVRIFNGTTGTVLRSLTLTGQGLSGPARVALGDINGDGRLDLVVGQAISGGTKARVYDALTLSEMFAGQNLFTFGGGYNQGLFVASLARVTGTTS